MAEQGHDSSRDGKLAEVKGSLVRSLAAVIAERGLRDAVGERVSPEARRLLQDPPLPTAWIDARCFNEIYEALLQKVGVVELRRMNREAVDRGVSPYLRGAAESLLRVVGISPDSLLSRFDRVAGTTARGLIYRFEPIDATSGYFEIEFLALHDVPMGAFVATAGALESIFEVCSTKGTIEEPEMVANGRRNRVRIKMSWQAKKK